MDALFVGLWLVKMALLAIAGAVLCVYGAKAKSPATFILGIAGFTFLANRITDRDMFGWAAGVLFVLALGLRIMENRRRRAAKEAADPNSPRLRH